MQHFPSCLVTFKLWCLSFNLQPKKNNSSSVIGYKINWFLGHYNTCKIIVNSFPMMDLNANLHSTWKWKCQRSRSKTRVAADSAHQSQYACEVWKSYCHCSFSTMDLNAVFKPNYWSSQTAGQTLPFHRPILICIPAKNVMLHIKILKFTLIFCTFINLHSV